jgi:hypothetical protein
MSQAYIENELRLRSVNGVLVANTGIVTSIPLGGPNGVATYNSLGNAITLTTTGTSGAATIVSNTLNIPNYTGALSGYVPYTGATQAVDLGAYNLTVNNVIVGRGTSTHPTNIAIGNSNTMGVYTATGSLNTAVGGNALSFLTSGYENTAFGHGALLSITTGYYNVGVGNGAGALIQLGINNTFIGRASGGNILNGSGNTLIGGWQGDTTTVNNVVLSDGYGNIRYRYDGTNNNFYQNVNFASTLGNGTYTYTLPSATGTLALVGDLSGYVPTSRTLTINGTTYDLSANRSWTIPAGVTSFNTRTGDITLLNTDVTGALGYTPEDVANKSTSTSLGTSNTLYPTQNAVKTYIDSAVSGAIILQGDWNASTNSPDISGTTTTGWAWRVSTDGSTNLGGITDWKVGDLAVKSAGGWVKIDNTDGVTSVFGRYGSIVAQSGDYTTAQVTESGNLYYLDSRARASLSAGTGISYSSSTGVISSTITQYTDANARASISLTTINNSGSSTYSSSTGILNVPEYTLSGLGGVPTSRTLTINGVTYDLSTDRAWSITAGVSSVTATSPLFSSGGSNPNLTIQPATLAQDGYLSYTDWSTFNNKIGGSGTTNFLPKFTGSGTIGNSVAYDGGSSIGINTTSPYASSVFKLDVNGGLIIKNTSGTTAQLILIDSDPSGGGNNGFVQMTAGGTSTTSYGALQTYYGTSLVGGALRLQPVGGSVLVNKTMDSGLASLQITGAIQQSTVTASIVKADSSGVLTSAIAGTDYLAPSALSGYVPTSRTLTINGLTYDLSADRAWTITAGVSSVFGRTGIVTAQEGDYSLTQLSDVTITTPSNGQVLKYNGTEWVNSSDSGLTSVGITTSAAALSITNTPLTSNGNIGVNFAGLASQYIRGDGNLANFPTSGGGGSSVAYYLNGSVNQGTFAGNTYYEMSKVPVIGAGTDFSRGTNGYIASFLTDANDPALLEIPAGNWNFETYFNASNGGGNPSFYIELYKYDGTTFTLIASNSAFPKLINDGTSIEAYFSALAVPQTSLTLTDRLAVRIYVNTSNRTITLHTEDSHLCEVITTFSTGLTALNGLTAQVQYFQTGTSGSDFNISSATATHTFNLPVASATNTGKLSSTDWNTFNGKQNALTNPITGTGASGQVAYWNGTTTQTGTNNFYWDNSNNQLGVGTNAPSAGVTSYSTVPATQFKAAGVAPAFTFSNTLLSPTLGCVFGLATGTGQFVTGTIAGDMAIANQSATAGAIVFGTGTTEKMRMTSAGTFSIGNTNSTYKLDVTGTSRFTGQLRLESTITNGTYTYTLPSATGTLALTTDLANYLPLTGGTLSGSLAGTNASFNYVSFNNSASAPPTITGFSSLTFIANSAFLNMNIRRSDGQNSMLRFPNDGFTHQYDLPTTDGTIALTSNLLGYVPTSRTLTINGTTYDLSADRSWTVSPNINATTTQDYTATAGQTVFTVSAGYTVGQLAVFYNGSKLAANEFTATNGTSFTLATAAQLNDILQAVSSVTGGGVGGTGTTNYIPKFTSSGVIGNSLFYDNGTQIGLGTTTPLGILHLYKSAATTRMVMDGDAGQSKIITFRTSGLQRFGIYVNNTAESGSNVGSDFQVRAYNDAGTLLSTPLFIKRSTGNVGVNTITPTYKLDVTGTGRFTGDLTANGVTIGASDIRSSSNVLTLGGTTERVRIDASGNVGINTTTPIYKLDVTSGDAYTTRFNSTAAQGGFTAWSNSGTAYGYAGNAYHIVVGGSVGDMAMTSTANLVLATGASLTERMRITSAGNVGIGNTGSPSYKLHVTGNTYLLGASSTSSDFGLVVQNSGSNNTLAVRNDGAIFTPGIYNFTTGSGANVVVFSDGSMQRSTSSLKYKNNVQDYTKGLNEVMQLRPVTYESKNPREVGVTFSGLIAEEVHDLGLTEFVQYAEDGTPDALAYSNMVALLVKSIQELEARLKTLENK